jgi:hypothetical protein
MNQSVHFRKLEEGFNNLPAACKRLTLLLPDEHSIQLKNLLLNKNKKVTIMFCMYRQLTLDGSTTLTNHHRFQL